MHDKYRRVSEIKAQTDELLTQLSECEYRTLDTWANNLAHLRVTFDLFSPFMTDDPDFLAWLNQHDPVMVSEIAMTGRALMALQNFFRVALKQTQ
ncbi:hypothetical protein IAE49_04125 [Kosakonia sp. S58]|uniref:hypothetical protein n=1 Tax=Kosakonia TaxID=1330547 RepID=UPI001659C48A|nr:MULTISPECIES: hypothetical protein [Kosakonia]MBK0078714.1 hypothetical protein [Kosakonia sp. S57]MBK0085423.1 hypothetical protein [Kosakonia sp. S58]QNQ18288.1 hypothetical protein HF650_13495 [Kosakonia sp. SMBL-WEM22]UGS48514.1 hypothetical protein JMT66_09960 [Kosakonia cowanii]